MADEAALAEEIREVFSERGLTLATAESCTGGLVGHYLTEIAGASDYYRGGVVSYADDAKRDLLDVPAHTLEHHGPVSAQTCVAMAQGARARFGASHGLAVTGIAGPSGGSTAKPVGLTYVAAAGDGEELVRRYAWQGDRHANKQASAVACLELLLEFVNRP
jgi:nicotinamide-nucleotide amidase